MSLKNFTPSSILNSLAPKELHVLLPYRFDRKTMYEFLAQALEDDLTPKSSRITLNFSRLNFVDPSAVTVLSNLIEYLRKKDVRVKFSNHMLKKDCLKYLDDSGFFLLYEDRQIFDDSKLRNTTLPLEKVTHERSHSWIANNFSPWIAPRVGLNEKSFGTVSVCLAEIFNNILDHSGEKTGCAFAQHYPKQNEVMLSVSDFGIGIPMNVRKVLPDLNDAQAIEKAMCEGFTTQSTGRNRGAGLDILTRYVVKNNRGTVMVNSLKGSFQCIYAASGVKFLPKKERVSYPGTLIQITFRTDGLEQIAVKEEFEW